MISNDDLLEALRIVTTGDDDDKQKKKKSMTGGIIRISKKLQSDIKVNNQK